MVPDKNSKIPYTDLKPKISQILSKKWQQLENENALKSYQIQPILQKRKLDPSKNRREETTQSWLHIDHTELTLSFIVKQEPPIKCSRGKPYRVKHVNKMKKIHPHSKSFLQRKKHERSIWNNRPLIKDIGP